MASQRPPGRSERLSGFHIGDLRILSAHTSRNAKLGELLGDHLAAVGRTDLLVDVQDLPIEADVKRPPRDVRRGDAVRFRHLPGRVAQDRIVYAQRLCESLVRFRGIDADGEKRDIERAYGIGALTERLALGRSATAVRLDEPGKNHRLLASEVSQVVSPAIRSLK